MRHSGFELYLLSLKTQLKSHLQEFFLKQKSLVSPFQQKTIPSKELYTHSLSKIEQNIQKYIIFYFLCIYLLFPHNHLKHQK